MSDFFASSSKIAAQKSAYAAVKDISFTSTSIIEYQSKGHVLIIGNSSAISRLADLPEPLSSDALLLDKLKPDAHISIDGALGQFQIQAGKLAFIADLILDLSPNPVLSMALTPPGYLSANEDDNFETIKEELGALVGTFDKPKYFNYDASSCAHGRSGNKGCTRCIDACPAEAISSIGEMIEVNSYRCHGGGICATVCPSGAISYAYPTARDLLHHVRTLILAYRQADGGAPNIAFVNEEQRQRVQHALPGALIICVEEVASVGPEV